MVFLSARWSNLLLFNYAVDPEMLATICPRGTVPDVREGSAFASLVAFDFLDTRVLGVPWPGYRNFCEINLRYYVRCGSQRGVAFVRELVPVRLVAAMAKLSYNEPYEYRPMTSRVIRRDGLLTVQHRLRHDRGVQRIDALALDRPHMPPDDSWAHFFKEHQWGFGTDHLGRTIRYEVRHPHWEVYPVERWKLHWDFGAVFGKPWEFLSQVPLHSVVLAKGSPVTVHVRGGVT